MIHVARVNVCVVESKLSSTVAATSFDNDLTRAQGCNAVYPTFILFMRQGASVLVILCVKCIENQCDAASSGPV